MPDSLSYSATEKKRGRRLFSAFGLINALAFLLLTGNVITLYSLKLGASRALLGLLASFPFLALLLLPIGRRLVRRVGVVRVLGRSWLARYVSLIPILFAPILVSLGEAVAAYTTLTICVLLFHVFRGVGMVSDSPLIGALSEGPDRGAFLARYQILVAFSSVLGGIVVVMLLGGDAPVWRYTILLILGIVLGIADVFLVYRIPEPPGAQQSASRPMFASLRVALSSANLRRFVLAFGVFCALSGGARAFLVVYARQVYDQPDNLAMLYTVIGSTGWVLMGFLARRVMDRLGAKPMMVFFGLIFLVSMVPLVATPELQAGYGIEIFLGVVFFVSTMGFTGGEYSAQTYFYAMIDDTERLDLGMVYFFAMGFGGVVGSLLGGLFLDWLAGSYGGDTLAAFRTFFGLLAVILVIDVLLFSRLARLGARSVASALSVIFSFRDMRTLGLLDRLSKSSSIEDERRAIRRIAATGSAEATEDLITRLSSPTFAVRVQALVAIESLPLTDAMGKALVEHLTSHQFSTAYRAAEILGRRGIRKGTGALETALESEDHLLISKAMVALARLGSEEAEEKITKLMETSQNPMITLHAVSALHILGLPRSIPALVRCMERSEIRDFVRDEIIIALADICGFGAMFYSGYRAFLAQHPLEELIDTWLSGAAMAEGLSAGGMAQVMEERDMSEGLLELLPKREKKLPWLDYFQESVGSISLLEDRRGRLLLVAMIIHLVGTGNLDPDLVSNYFDDIHPKKENP